MIVTGINATIYTFSGSQYVLFSTYRDLYEENGMLRKSLGEKDTLLSQMGEQLREVTDERWHMRLDKINLKKCPTPQKKLLAALHEHGNNNPIRVDTLALATGMSRSTAQRHLDEMEAKRYLTRRYERNDLYIRLNPDIERSPTTIERLTSVERNPNWGGLREKKELEELACSNCSSPHVRGHRHDSYICDDCGHVGDEWIDIPNMPTLRLPVVSLVAPGAVQISLPATPAPALATVLGRHPRGIACPDCQAREHWRAERADWGGLIYVCAICTDGK